QYVCCGRLAAVPLSKLSLQRLDPIAKLVFKADGGHFRWHGPNQFLVARTQRLLDLLLDLLSVLQTAAMVNTRVLLGLGRESQRLGSLWPCAGPRCGDRRGRGTAPPSGRRNAAQGNARERRPVSMEMGEYLRVAACPTEGRGAE